MHETSHPGIRPALLEDARAILQFLQPFMNAKQILRRHLEDIEALTRHGFVAENEGRVVGFAAVEVYSKKLAELQCLGVSPECRGLGLGKSLILHCVQRAQQLNLVELMAITSSDELFRGCGFDYSLPNQKRALFVRTREDHDDHHDEGHVEGT